jgi:two-component system, OmpR family, phosphate regulon sensor histidine kinase PhoR
MTGRTGPPRINMTSTNDREQLPRWVARARRARLPLAAGAVVFAGLWVGGALAAAPALAGYALIAIAALIGVGSTPVAPAALPSAARSSPDGGGPLIDAVLAAMPDPVIALGRGGEVVALNARAAAIAPALRRGEAVSFGLRNPEILDAVRRARASGTVQHVELFERVPIDRWHDVIVTPIAASGVPPGAGAQLVLMTFHDLTPLRRVEEMRADFVANASHELRTPLAALSGFIETLQGPAREDAAARERFLAIMATQADRMARLIDDLLSLSRIELNAHLRPDKEVDLLAIIRQVADGLQMLASDRNVEVRVAAPADRVLVRGDRDELLRVFENLVENALKYAASGKRIDIALAVGEGAGGAREARVTVRDYGPGIAPEHLPRLTERFYRVDVADSRAQGGTGLGLALVKHILNRHGGRLTIDSAIGQGATFSAHLPLAAAKFGGNPQLSTRG